MVTNAYISPMKLNTVQLSAEIQKILNETGLSPEELSNKTGVSKATIYAVLNHKNPTTQRSVARRISEAMNYRMQIEDERVYFIEEEEQFNSSEPEPIELSRTDKEILEIVDKLSEKEKRIVLTLMRSLAE